MSSAVTILVLLSDQQFLGRQSGQYFANGLVTGFVHSGVENSALEKEKLFLLFNGRYLMSSDGQLLLDTVAGKAVEKKKKTTDVSFAQEKEEDFFTFDYSYARQAIKNEGGIPRGLYQMSCRESGSLAHGNVRKHLVGTISWGQYHWCLTPFPDTDMRGRDRKSFTIHGGHIPESGGVHRFDRRRYFIQKIS